MSQRITSGTQCSLYDSVTGFAFGPVFENEAQAEAFLKFAAEEGFSDLRPLKDNTIDGMWADFHMQPE